ncbi:ketoacyl-synt-domain-containing protein [Lophiostoma macrostomum CBS 122681]|uniref:Ketoacyl-synt-domain-containing protein n=1 Tax=Lophiostoma macrostomum CBS 122681 TaxID=1314788 RepID=A0A6A6TAW4_9PLEO|nr:ketoacyl-synt-domain-containing protein [Lophiostoma macrostomum CBS 122681]
MTQTERSVCEVWANVLGHDNIGLQDNFFEIGGDSVRVVQGQRALEKMFGRLLPTASLFQHYTVEALASYLEGEIGDNTEAGASVASQGFRQNEDIAVIGMACRLPGGISSPNDFWQVLEQGVDATSDVPTDRWDAQEIYDANPEIQGKSYCQRGGFLDSVDEFDAKFFGISPKEARAMDPAHRVMLETSWEGCEHAGYTLEQLRGSQTGVYVGVCNIGAHTNQQCLEDLDGYHVTGTAGATISGRISYVLGLEGPSMTVDTACASSLVTTHMACTALRQGECNMALASGVSLLLNASMHVEFSRLRGMSSDGRCRAFAEESSGTGWAEGCTVILFKRLSDAVRDGNRIWACIRGSAVNHVGRTTPGLTVPSAPAQQRLIRTALEASKLQPQDIDLVEAHGTGTKLGDPIEGASLAAVFGKRAHESEPLWIGSCKSNIGHTQAAAGLAGLIKVVIALDRGVMPRTLYAESPTTAIDWQSANLRLIQKPRAWLSGRPDRPRRAGISAFGIGGTNAHVILEEPPLQFSVGSDQVPLTYPPELPFLLSGQTDAALSEQVIKLHQHIQNSEDKETDRLGHVAYSLATTRTHFRRRIVFMANNKAALLAKLAGKVALPRSSSQGSRIAMLFTGQGCEILGVGNELYEAYPTFRHSMDEVMTHFAALDVGFTLKEVMDAALGTEDAARLQHTDVVQCALFALEVSLWHLWHSWGVKPTILLGHSIGELAAAYAAGVFNLSDACRLVAARGSLMRGLRPGKMISLEADGKETLEAIQHLDATKKIDVAGYNGPSQTIASGDGDAIEQLGSYFVGLGRKVKLLPVSHAFHSHHVEEMLEPLRAVVETIRFNTPKIPIVSCFTGKLADEGQLEQVDYWLLQARHAVQFADGMQTLYEHGVNMFIELGPQPVLAGLGAACLPADNTLAWLPSLVPGSNETTAIQRSLAELHTRHVPLNWHDYFEQIGSFQRVELPTYAFQREHFPLGKAIGTAKLKSVDGGDRKVLRIPRQDTSNLTYRVSWNLVDQEKNPNVVRGASWGILTSEVDLNKSWEREVTGALNHVGIRIIPVKTIEDAKNLHIDGLLCLRDATSADDGGDVVCKAHTMTAKGLTLLQTAAHVDFRPSLVWITRDAVGTGVKDNMVSGLGAGPLWGLMRTARNERPDLPLRLIDLDGSSLHVLHEALALTTEPECVLRSGDVLVPRMERLESPRILSKQPLVRPNGGVLITGGLGGLGRQVATWLAKIHGICYLVLISRRGMDTPGAQEFVACLAELGTQADVVACEMSDSERIKSSLALFDEGRPLRGVIHAAGAQDNGILTALTPERCTTALVPKIDGAWYLHQLTKEMKIDLDFFVLFSSIFGIMGMPGHGSYAAANTFLDALAHTRRAENLPATSIAYGAWEGEGMASGIITSTMTHFTQSGLGMLTIAEGLQQLEDAIRGDRPLTIAAALNQERLQSYYGRGSIPPLYRSLLHRHSNDVGHEWDLSKILSKVSQTQRPVVVMKMVQETIANTLGFADLAEIDLDLPLQDIGLDSLTAVLIRNRLTELTGLPLSARYALQHPNMKSLSHDLFSRIEKDHSEQSPTNRESHATSAPEKVWLDMDAIRKGCVDSSFTFENVSKTAGPPRAVLVTGATGFIGAFIAHELLKCGVTVYCIVRASNDVHGLQRLSETLSGYGLWQDKYATLLHAVVGDMSQPLFGLSEERFNALADQVDSICHSASLVDWMRPLEDYIGPNMISTHETVRLASRGRGKAIHFISTISSVPKYLGYDIKQDDEEYGYTTSKYLAEQMVVASHYRGAKAAVYRLPFITASTETGHFRLDQGDFLHNLISGCLEIGAFPSLDAHMSAVLPVDYISKTVVALMTRDLDRIGQTWDLVHGNPLSFNRFFALLAAASTNQPTIPFLQWRDRALEFISKHPTSPLARIAALLDGISDDKAAVAMVSGWPVVDPILGRVEYAAPTLGEQFAKNYVSRIDLARGKNNGTK